MQKVIDIIVELSKTGFGIFQLFVIGIIILCAFAILLSIAINFAEGNRREKPRKEKKSVVETGTMLLFFLVFYLLIRFNIGAINVSNLHIRIPLILIGTPIIILGTVFNIKGRLYLGKNWANQIKIYKDHTFVKEGPYKIVRHPLYASLIWIFYAASLIYLNYMAFIATTLIFIPFMYYRAKQEEELLKEQFKNYGAYARETGMFFPKFKR